MSKPPPSAPSAAAPAPALAAALASPSPKKKPRGRPGSPVRLARAEADSVTALVKENKKLAAELRQLHQWREAVGGSFKLAWQHERAAHQRDINGVTLDLGAAAERSRQLERDLEVERLQHQQRAAAAEGEVERLRAALQRAHQQRQRHQQHTAQQLHGLERQLAQARADKAALCEEFVEKLRRLEDPTLPPPPGAAAAGAAAAASSPAAAADTATGGAAGELLSLQEHADYSQLSIFRGGAGAHQQQQQLRVALATASPSAAPPAGALAGGDNDDPPSSQRTQTMANELGELFERFDTQLRSPAPRSPAAAPRSPAGSLRSPGAALRSPSARSTSRFSAAIEPADPVTATGARAHERDARAEQLGAIAQQKLAQQLARVEGELDRVQRLHAVKSRRLLELEEQIEGDREASASVQREVVSLRDGRDEVMRLRDAEAKRADAAVEKVAGLEAELAAAREEVSAVRLEQTKLLNKIDTLELTGGGDYDAAAAAAARPGAWRPPKHPTRALDQLWDEIAAANARAPGSHRSDAASTLVDGEWPDELRL